MTSTTTSLWFRFFSPPFKISPNNDGWFILQHKRLLFPVSDTRPSDLSLAVFGWCPTASMKWVLWLVDLTCSLKQVNPIVSILRWEFCECSCLDITTITINSSVTQQIWRVSRCGLMCQQSDINKVTQMHTAFCYSVFCASSSTAVGLSVLILDMRVCSCTFACKWRIFAKPNCQ